MKTLHKFLLLLLAVFLLSTQAVAHSGNTDKNGGHYDRDTGIYHYHNSKGGGCSAGFVGLSAFVAIPLVFYYVNRK